ncbi:MULTISPECIES: hypothetical protein [Streptomyces]|uniref:hypothetical protein n=1 Tax=Streptomyces TaxID=1883 RepID=UPI0029BB29D3|nr:MULTISPECIES: hypothetical protein [Streptomyces]MDX3067075.1 hypothetical protein [Streptomyces sp. ND04-05B]WRY84750.1 hypothetical protein OG388_27715 [Streptomyces clavifer]WUC30463.1 hypothetical protein OG927_25320 [Streptomyces clavifer]
MEQRIDSNTKPEFAAGTDPAYIPGLTAPAPARTEGEAEKAPEGPEAPGASGASAEDEATAVAEGAETADASPDAVRDATPEASEDADEGGGAPAEGPVFAVSDRRGSITVDRDGVRFTLDDQEAEFDWAEIGAVEVKTARFGRRFTVTVHVSSRRWFNAEVEAESRSSLKEWTAELDAALDAYFEEN